MDKHTPTPWDFAADSYGKVRHSKKACVYASVKGEDGERIVNVAQRIDSWADAAFIVRAVNAHEELIKAMRLVSEAMNTAVDNDAQWNRAQMRSHLFQIQTLMTETIAKAEAE